MRPILVALVLACLPLAIAVVPTSPASPADPLFPDLQSVVPSHVQLVFPQGREVIRFTNGIANTGDGHFRLRPSHEGDRTLAVQELLAASGAVVDSRVVSEYEFHPTHRHWHVGAVARFEVRTAVDDGTGGAFGPVVANDRGFVQSSKVTFCLIDWVKMSGPARTTDRTYFDCDATLQGISPGWIDQYHHALDGQWLDITGVPTGVYYLVSESNPDAGEGRGFVESDTTNNVAWRSFLLNRDRPGNPTLTPVARSACAGVMCGEGLPNR